MRKFGVKVGRFIVFFADWYYHACCRCKALNLHTTIFLQNLIFAPFKVLIDTWYKNTQLIKVHIEQLSLNQKNLFHLKSFLIKFVALAGGTCSTWSNFTDNMSLFEKIKCLFK